MWPWLLYIISAILILLAGRKITFLADEIADRTGVGKGLIGAILLGTATSLPELITSASSIAIVGNPDLALGNIFGSNLFNLLIIAILDLWYVKRAYDRGNMIVAGLSLLLGGLAILGLVLQPPAALGHVGFFSVAIFICYLGGMVYLVKSDKKHQAATGDLPLPEGPPEGGSKDIQGQLDSTDDGASMKRLVVFTVICGVAIIGAGMLAAHACGLIEVQTGWGGSFVGSLFLAVATSLPELVVSITAIKLGSSAMAIGNVFGSNALNIFIIPIVDIIYVKDTIFHGTAHASAHIWAVAEMFVLSFIVLTGFWLEKKSPRRIRLGRLGIDSWLMVAIYLGGAYAIFRLSTG